MTSKTIGDIGEFALIELLTRGVSDGGAVLLGPGDDAAVLALAGDLAVSTDTMVEGVHFRSDWSGPEDIGRKAVAACVADAEAMGAIPRGVVISLAAPAETPLVWAEGFAAGVLRECDRAGVRLVGGDLAKASLKVITVTVLADLDGRLPVTRAGAAVGDVVAFTGRLGWAAAGLAVLARGFRSPGAVVVAHRVPEVPYGEGVLAAEAGAHAMIDVSDGLLADLGHIAQASGVRIELVSSAFEIAEPQHTVASALGGGDPLNFLLTGGDDHALVATFSRDRVPPRWTVIGEVTAGDPVVLVDGSVPETPDAGWRHF